MEQQDILQKLKNALKHFIGAGKFPVINEIKDPTIKNVFGVCCGPRLFSNALKLHGEDLSGISPKDSSKSQDQNRP
jgi:hypothetical protein